MSYNSLSEQSSFSPARQKPPGPYFGEENSSSSSAQNAVGKVLLVDDNQDLLEMASVMFEDAGFEVLMAHSGEEALDILRREPGIEALLTDVVMPGMNGVELGHEAKRMNSALRIVLVSGYPNPGNQPGKGNVHDFEFLKKPYRIADVLRILSKSN